MKYKNLIWAIMTWSLNKCNSPRLLLWRRASARNVSLTINSTNTINQIILYFSPPTPHHSLFRNVPLLFNPHLGFSGFLFVLYSVILEYSLCFAPRPDDTKYVVTPRGATLATNTSWNTQNGWNESTCICFEPSIQLSLHGRVDSRELGTLHGKVTTCKPLSPLHL